MSDLSIAICDDEREQSEHLSRLVLSWAKQRGRGVRLISFQSAKALLFDLYDGVAYDGVAASAAHPVPSGGTALTRGCVIESAAARGTRQGRDVAANAAYPVPSGTFNHTSAPQGAAHILLLDIQMPDMDGMTLAKRLREAGDKTQIVFITGFADWILEGYEVDALHYLLKPVDERKLFEVLDKALVRVAEEGRSIQLTADGAATRVPVGEIMYAEAFSHYVEIHTKSGGIRVKMTLGALEEQLGEGFFRCHRSYIAGLKYVRSVSRTSVILENEVTLPLSRKLYDAANEAFIQYNWGGDNRGGAGKAAK
ncbi:MAG: LytTR family DNA-binding domain-containing protein [Oscillospiraceae bacterium]|nr:LytTR family DNA-binding domain-containing protein [Oscillospiraceae bacterium]